ncbi:arginine--tRNA ligase, partial [bacterium]|nr:arginine--tRNA ligase [bacterium]
KSDGGYNYGTFDLAGIRFRIFELEADRLIYVTDSRQSLHFSQVFEAAKSCGWANRKGNEISLEHVPFGSVLDENNKPLKTRSGENIKLSDLLSEAIDRALVVVNEKNPSLSEESKKTVARAVGIGAVKYADLSQNRNNDYVFSWNRMLSLNGNTAPYLQYAHARICSIFKKGNVSEEQFPKNEINLAHPSERALGLKLLQFPETVLCVADELRPHVLCNYLYELATVFSFFYDQCPVLSASSAVERASRLEMCFLVRSVLAKGLSVLGLESPKEM